MNLFGKAKPKTQPKDAIVRLRETLELLEKREKFLQTKIDNELSIAKQNATKNKRVAIMALKRKKQYENEMTKISGSRMTLETQMSTIETANLNLEVLNSMRLGAEAMKNTHGAMDINKVDNTMDEIRDQMDLANEISEAISQPIGFGIEMDEDELAAELEELEQEELDSKLLDMEKPPSTALPSVPSEKVAQTPRPVKQQPAAVEPATEDEDAELEELRMSMAM